MGRYWKHVITVAEGKHVGCTPKARGKRFRVQYRHPTEDKYVEGSTGVEVPSGWDPKKNRPPPPAWFVEAERVVRKAYSSATGTGLAGAGKVTWEEAETYLMEDITRDGSERTYRSALCLLRELLPTLKGPKEVTAEHAALFAKKYARQPYRRAKSEDGKLRHRKAQTVKTTLNNLSVLWVRLKELKLVTENVWAEVKRPSVPVTLPHIPKEESFEELVRWLDRRFPGPEGTGWGLLKTFVKVKALAGCRLMDLCRVESNQFDEAAGTLRIRPDQDKTNQERLIVLPPALADALARLRGGEFLWGRYTEDTATFRPGPRRAKVFAPSVLYHALLSIFREFGKACPDHKVKTHDLRKRAITLTVKQQNGNLEAAARAIPVTADTARRHYIDGERVSKAADIQRETAPILLSCFDPPSGQGEEQGG